MVMHMTGEFPTYEAVVSALCHAVVRSAHVRVAGPTTRYRCKATYSLYPPPLAVSPLAMDEVNALCQAVEAFSTGVESGRSCHFYRDHPRFFFEVCAKVTRRGEAMVKIVFLNEELAESHTCCSRTCTPAIADTTPAPTLFHQWYYQTGEPALLWKALKDSFPRLVSVVAHVRLTGPHLARKPDKTCAYLPLCRADAHSEGDDRADGSRYETTITEYTPNGIPFILSADSFCEVNHPMEDAIFRTMVDFLRLECSDKGRGGRRAFISGRDVNSVVKTFEQYYTGITAVTSCPNVFADTQRNGIRQASRVAKHEMAPVLWAAVEGRGAGSSEDLHVLITAGRHGLHPTTSIALSQLAEATTRTTTTCTRLTDVLYVSCNVDSLARDLFLLKQGLTVTHVRTFDFFPGTDYVMTVVHLQPMARPAASGSGDLLVLPIGPPGAGKSSSGRALAAFFDAASVARPPTLEKRGRARGRESEGGGLRVEERPESITGPAGDCTAPPHIPRAFAHVAPNTRVVLVERDRIFHQLREAGATLRQAKTATHAALLAALESGEHGSLCCGGCSSEGADGQARPDSVCTCTGKTNKPTLSSCVRRVVYLDSTNGCAEARELYRRLWAAGSERGSVFDRPSLALWFTCTLPDPCQPKRAMVTLLMERVAARGPHPSFPSASDDQERKLEAILGAMEPLTSAGLSGATASTQNGTGAVVYHVDAASGDVRYTVLQVITAVVASLHFAPDLVNHLVPLAVEHLRGSRNPG